MASRLQTPSEQVAVKYSALPSECAAPDCQRPPRTRVNGLACCRTHEQRQRKWGSFDLRPVQPRPWRTCSIVGCEKASRTREGRLCEMHYVRHYRRGTFDLKQRADSRRDARGYVWTYAPAHPIAGKSGVLYEHRAVLYDTRGPSTHLCHWCRREVEWSGNGKRKLVVDHLDGNKGNNDPANLLPSCHRCNSTRGLFQQWVEDHRDDPLLWSMYEAARAKAA